MQCACFKGVLLCPIISLTPSGRSSYKSNLTSTQLFGVAWRLCTLRLQPHSIQL